MANVAGITVAARSERCSATSRGSTGVCAAERAGDAVWIGAEAAVRRRRGAAAAARQPVPARGARVVDGAQPGQEPCHPGRVLVRHPADQRVTNLGRGGVVELIGHGILTWQQCAIRQAYAVEEPPSIDWQTPGKRVVLRDPMDITELILHDHHEQRRIFAQLEDIDPSNTEALGAVSGRACGFFSRCTRRLRSSCSTPPAQDRHRGGR